MKKYSKSTLDIHKIKMDFFSSNDKKLSEELNKKDFYTKQEKRKYCKNCNLEIGEIDFTVQGVGYSICSQCEHLNGIYEDSLEYTKVIYNDDDGDFYSKNYLNNFDLRVKNIYKPKLDFIKECLKKENCNDISIIDIGCGGGHFIKACEEQNIDAIGYDVNKILIDLGNSMLKKNRIEKIEDIVSKTFDERVQEIVENTDKSVLTLVGCLEHLREPHGLIKSFLNSNCKYFFFSVPCFSLTVFIEHCFPDVWTRHLNSGHTHMYTKKSIEFLLNKYNLETVGEWWFGSEIYDLFRSMNIRMNKNGCSEKAKDFLSKYLFNNIDLLQKELDKKETCSAIQILVKKK